MGLQLSAGPKTVKMAPFEVIPPLVTVIVASAGESMRLAATSADNWLVLPKSVVSAAPFHWTTEFAANPEPVTVSVKEGPPAIAADGLRAMMTTPGFVPGGTTGMGAKNGAAPPTAWGCADATAAQHAAKANSLRTSRQRREFIFASTYASSTLHPPAHFAKPGLHLSLAHTTSRRAPYSNIRPQPARSTAAGWRRAASCTAVGNRC